MAEEPEKQEEQEPETIQVMLTPKDGGPWFPAERQEKVEVKGRKILAPIDYPGASVRDTFALGAMKGILENQEQIEKVSELAELLSRDEERDPNGYSYTWINCLSHMSYEIADAMLRERGRGE